ncbi:MAG: hypothetical protein ACRDOI_24970 [Trebonia sp.]
MTATDTLRPPPAAAPRAWRVSPAAHLAWLHLRSRRAPAALLALLACGAALWASLHYHWWLGTGNAADELPMILQGCAAAIIVVTMHSPFGEPERAAGRWLPFLRGGLTLALCLAAIGFFALGAAVADHSGARVPLFGGILPVVRNVLGMTGIGLIFCLFSGALTAWIGPVAFTAISQYALIANYSEPLTWPTRPPTDRGGWIAATIAFAVGLIAFTIKGARIRPSDELPQADDQRFRAKAANASITDTRGARDAQPGPGNEEADPPAMLPAFAGRPSPGSPGP